MNTPTKKIVVARDLDAELALIDARAQARPPHVQEALAVMRDLAPAYSSSDAWPVHVHVGQMQRWLHVTAKDLDARRASRRSGLLLDICEQRVASTIAKRGIVQAALAVLLAADQERPTFGVNS